MDKHGISLAMAEEFEWEEAVTWPDIRYDYREFRMIGLGYIGDRLYNMVFVDRGEERRIVSLRKALRRLTIRRSSPRSTKTMLYKRSPI